MNSFWASGFIKSSKNIPLSFLTLDLNIFFFRFPISPQTIAQFDFMIKYIHGYNDDVF